VVVVVDGAPAQGQRPRRTGPHPYPVERMHSGPPLPDIPRLPAPSRKPGPTGHASPGALSAQPICSDHSSPPPHAVGYVALFHKRKGTRMSPTVRVWEGPGDDRPASDLIICILLSTIGEVKSTARKAHAGRTQLVPPDSSSPQPR
jgi:hypothetical protein